jgi:hypothetical protein
LLGPETGPCGLPCAVSVPNLSSDRGVWVAGQREWLNVRWLMYQTLIFAAVVRDDARGLAAALDAEDMKRPADPLIHGVWRDIELRRDLFRRQMLVDESQAVQLPHAQSLNPRYHVGLPRTVRPIRGLSHARPLFHP